MRTIQGVKVNCKGKLVGSVCDFFLLWAFAAVDQRLNEITSHILTPATTNLLYPCHLRRKMDDILSRPRRRQTSSESGLPSIPCLFSIEFNKPKYRSSITLSGFGFENQSLEGCRGVWVSKTRPSVIECHLYIMYFAQKCLKILLPTL